MFFFQILSNIYFSVLFLVGIFKLPNLEKRDPPIGKLPVTLVCDNVREPGNLGSILRIAAGIPVERVILLSGN